MDDINLFDSESVTRPWAHLAALQNEAEIKVTELHDQYPRNVYLEEKWQTTVGVLRNAAHQIGQLK